MVQIRDTATTHDLPLHPAVGRLGLVLAGSRWLHLLVLALPFAIVIAGWDGLTGSFPAFQGGDEPVHYQIVQAVMHQWPRPLFGGYGAWSGPFMYWLLATLSLPFSGSLVAVRLVVAAFSWGTCAIAYVLFRDRLHARPPDALALALLLAISPFFLGQSFRVLTDNPTWFFVVLGLERLLAYVHRPAAGRLAAFAACLAAATTMRHVAVWMLLPGLVAVLSVGLSRRQRAISFGLLALGVLPLVALLLYWGGPLPPNPGGVPAATPLAAIARTRNLLLSLGVVGMYAVFMIPASELAGWWQRARAHPRWTAVLVVAAAVAAGLLAAGTLGRVSGFLALVARINAPRIAGVSLFWWALVPAGAAATCAFAATRYSDTRSRLLLTSLLGVLLSAMANPRWFERYVDFPLLLVLAGLALTAAVPLGRADRLRWLLAGLISVGSFVWLL